MENSQFARLDSSRGWGESLVAFFQDIKLAHSIFALPFAAVGLLLAHTAWPGPAQLLLLLVCMVAARSFAMGMNRYLDRSIDAANPRTARRMIPRGQLAASRGLAFSLAWGVVFCAAAWALSALAGMLSLPVLLLLAFYSYMKRLSWLTHWYLGFCLGMAPVAVNVALGVSLRPAVLLVGLAVMLWTAGFDILYALQDEDFDRQRALQSVPARFGSRLSLVWSRLCFLGMLLALFFAGRLDGRGVYYYAGLALVALILSYEHWLVRDLPKAAKPSEKTINAAFFTVNAWVGLVFYALTQLDVLLWNL